jgi:hypothetical protein
MTKFGTCLNKSILIFKQTVIAHANTQITKLIEKCKEKQIREFYIRSPLTCNLTEQFVRSVMVGI